MSIFKDMLKDNESLFLDEIALDFDYVPKTLKHRENEQQYVATCMKPLFNDRNGKNLFITGKPGIGKTAAIKWVLRELENETDSIYTIYINCWKHDTAYKIILDICSQINYKYTHNKKSDELLKNVSDVINKKSLVLVLDEVDKLQEQSIIYNLLENIYKKMMILITNENDFLATLDSRIKSRLLPETLEFRPYNYEETKSILKERRDYAFVEGIWNEEGFCNIVDKTYEAKDIRTGLYLMREAGNIAENKSSRKITKEFSELAINKLSNYKIKDSNSFDGSKKEILNIVKENSGKRIKELYNIYFGKGFNISYRSFFNKIMELEKAGVVNTQSAEGRGKSTLVSYGSKRLDEFK